MLLLGFDTSTAAVTAAVGDGARGGAIRAERTDIETNRHGELLAPLVSRVLDDAGVAPADLTAIAVGLGPGPFTGLRVGIVTAKAMGDALSVPVYGECSLDIMARQHRGGGPLAVVTDARRKQVYWGQYDAAGARVRGPDLAPPDVVASVLHGAVERIAGAGAQLYRDAFDAFDLIADDPYPRAGALIGLVADRLSPDAAPDDLTPLYLRRPDAQPPGRPKQVTPA